MGNNKFKLSDMIPNAWFYKLKDMSKAKRRDNANAMKKSKVSSPTTSQRSRYSSSHYFFTEPSRAGKLYNSPNIHTKSLEIPFIESPRRSSKRRSRRKTIYKPSPIVLSSSASANFISHSTVSQIKPNQVESSDYYASSIESSSESEFHEYVTSESECDSFALPDLLNGLATNCSCRVSSSTNDIIIDMNNESFRANPEKLDGFDTLSELDLPPILTRPVKFDYNKVIEADDLKANQSLPVKKGKEERRIQRDRKSNPGARKSSSNSTGIRLRVNSPKLASRKVQAYARRSVSSKSSRNSTSGYPEGFAVVKSSIDPQRDFRESMVEMIVENNIQASKDLEDLLACYLSLNSSEYHDLIVKAFEQIWFDMAQLRM